MSDIRPSTAGEARVRLLAHIQKYKEYIDRDRDILTLHLLDRVDELHRKMDNLHGKQNESPSQGEEANRNGAELREQESG